MKLFFGTATIMAITFLAACNKSDSDRALNTFERDAPFTIKPNTTLIEVNGDLSITFKKMISDSRCPITWQCVWQGEVGLEFLYEKNGAQQLDTLILMAGGTDKERYTTVFQGYTIELQQVNPYPKAANDIPAGDYIAGLKVTK